VLEAVEHQRQAFAISVQMRAAGVRQVVALLRTVGFDGGVAQLFQIGQRGVDHTGAGCVEAIAKGTQRFDEFIAVAGVLFQQAQQHHLQIVGRHAAATREPAPVAPEAVGIAPAAAVRGTGKPIPTRAGVVGMMKVVMGVAVMMEVGMAHGMALTMYLKI